MIKYTADMHLGHVNIIKHDGRPFSNVDIMDKILLENYNNEVNKDDEVYIDGDLIYRSGKHPTWYLDQMPGHKHLILGNHDKIILEDKSLWHYFEEIDKILTIKDNGRMVVISHCPMAEWDGYFRGWYHVYAHIHNNLNKAYHFMKEEERALNAGCMINDYKPVTLDELIINNTKFKKTH